MSLLARLLQAVRSWRRRRGGHKSVRFAGIAMEQLDHRQLLSVNFTGNVLTDFPATQSPGVVVLPDNPNVLHPVIGGSATFQNAIKVSGFDISEVRVSYSASDDTLSIGLNQPASQLRAGSVIAGDADNNGNSATVNPVVQAEVPSFQDLPDLQGTEHMAAFIDFLGTGNPQIVAGFNPVPSSGDTPPKLYTVNQAIPTGPNAPPAFGTELPQYEGNVYLMNSAAHPHLEFAIAHFSQLYASVTGHALTSDSVINVGAFAGSGQDGPISEAFFPAAPVNIGSATLPNTCPPASPPILINPHEHRVIDTSHRDIVRVYVQGSSGFDVSTINPSTVSLDGAQPIAHFTRRFPRNEFPVAVYAFLGKDIDLPAGNTTATFTAQTFSGQEVTSSKQVLNIPFSAQVPGRLHSLMDKGSVYPGLGMLSVSRPSAVDAANTTRALPARVRGLSPATVTERPSGHVRVNVKSAAAARSVRVNYRDQVSRTGTTTPVALPRSTVALTSANEEGSSRAYARIPGKLQRTLNEYLNQASDPRAATAGRLSASAL